MFTPDLFRKLKPILGKQIENLEAVYLAGDEESRQSVRKVLEMAYMNTVTGIQPPPYISGKYPLGMVISGNKTLYPFYLRDEDFYHMGIFGQTGRGKTNAMLHLLQTLSKHKIPWLVFDWKRTGYRDLSKHDIHIFTVGRDVSPFYFNPLIPPPGVDDITWYKQFIQCISHAYFLGHGCEVILQDVISRQTETLIDILNRLQTYPAKWRKLQWLQSTERAIKALCYGGISNVLNAKVCQPINNWLDKNIVLELDALTDSEAKFLVNIIMSQIYLYRKEKRHSGLQHVTVIEEAHNVLKKEAAHVEAKSVMDKIFREIREYGESMIIIDQMPSTILDSAVANTATQITLSLKHSDDVKAAGKAMLLDQDESLFLGKLPVGTAIVKLQNRWHAPFMVKLPLVTMQNRSISDEMIAKNHNGGQNTMKNNMKSNIGSCSAQNRPEQACPDENRLNKPVLKSDKRRTGINKLLLDIARNPLSAVRER
ncbi:ATP-binding protein, partial [Candidatus Poribacteria bacterium]